MSALALWVLASLGPCAEVSQCKARVVSTDAELAKAGSAAVERLGLKLVSRNSVEAKGSPGVADAVFEASLKSSNREIVVELRSLTRAPSVYGVGRERLVAVPKPEWRARALEAAVREAMKQAFADLSARIAESTGQGRRALRFSLYLNGLDPAARKWVREKGLPCLRQQLDVVGASGAAREQGGYLEESIEYRPAANEPRESLAWQVEQARSALLSGPKAACSVSGTAVAKYTAQVSADELNRAVRVVWR